jgi:uncharacterized protein DUF1488
MTEAQMLFHSKRGYSTTGDYVEFYMDDERTAGVPCRVSQEALNDRAARDYPRRHSELPQVRFETFRTEIEKIASDKHARGIIEADGYVLVTTFDLN